jgi:hypothetical protein
MVSKKAVIPTEATHSFIVSSAVEGPRISPLPLLAPSGVTAQDRKTINCQQNAESRRTYRDRQRRVR